MAWSERILRGVCSFLLAAALLVGCAESEPDQPDGQRPVPLDTSPGEDSSETSGADSSIDPDTAAKPDVTEPPPDVVGPTDVTTDSAAPSPCPETDPLDKEGLSARFATDIYPLLAAAPAEGGCVSCHNPLSSQLFLVWPDPQQTFEWLWSNGMFALDGTQGTLPAVLLETATVRMPYQGPYWSPEDIQTVTDFVCALETSGLAPQALCEGDQDPGNVLLRRLSNYEYDRSVAHIMGDDTQPGLDFPSDSPAHGFDNVVSAQTLTAGRLEKYHSAAHQIAVDTLHVPAEMSLHYEAEGLKAFSYTQVALPDWKPGWGGPKAGGFFHFQRMKGYVTLGLVTLPYDGTYTLRARVRGINAETKVLKDGEMVGDGKVVKPLAKFVVSGVTSGAMYVDEEEGWQIFEVTVDLQEGLCQPQLWLDNVAYGTKLQIDVQLDVDWIEIEGPSILPEYDAERVERYYFCAPEAEDWAATDCASKIVEKVLAHTWRRPATPVEIARYLGLIQFSQESGGTFKDAVELVLEGALLSPHFLYRPEVDAKPNVPEPHDLTDHELATRLSYFLWSSVPDDELRALADAGALQSDVVLAEQVDRMLDDPQAAALIQNFASQWLHLKQMEQMAPSQENYPEFDDALRAAMVTEVTLLIQAFLDEDWSLLDIVDTDFTFLNGSLSAHYGIDLPAGADPAQFHLVDVAGMPRGGLLFSAGFLTLTSHSARTSPTKRGKWILDQLLCKPPEDPPGDVAMVVEAPEGIEGLSVKEVLALHSSDPTCKSCHQLMDGLGVPLENFDPLGRWRTLDDFDMTVAPVMELPGGEVIDGPEALAEYLKSTPSLSRCITRKIVTYALGRDPQVVDLCALGGVEDGFAASGYTLRGLIKSLVLSPLFRQRRAPKDGEYDYLTGGSPDDAEGGTP